MAQRRNLLLEVLAGPSDDRLHHLLCTKLSRLSSIFNAVSKVLSLS